MTGSMEQPTECFAVAPGFPFGQPLLRLADLVTVDSFSGDVVSHRRLGAGPTVIRLRITRKPGNFCRVVRSTRTASSFPPPPPPPASPPKWPPGPIYSPTATSVTFLQPESSPSRTPSLSWRRRISPPFTFPKRGIGDRSFLLL